MTAPGSYVNITTRRGPAVVSPPPAATVFQVQATPWGPVGTPVLVRNLDELGAANGLAYLNPAQAAAAGAAALAAEGIPGIPVSTISQARTATATMFAEGVERLYVRRLVGPDAARSTLVLVDADDDPAVTLTGLYPGALPNLLSVAVAAGSTSGKKVTVSEPGGAAVILPAGSIVLDNLANNAAIVAAINGHAILSQLVTAVAGIGGIVANAGATPLADGTTDLNNAQPTDTDGLVAAYTFPAELGPGVILDGTGIGTGVLAYGGDANLAADAIETLAGVARATRRIFLLPYEAQEATADDVAAVAAIAGAGANIDAAVDELVDRHGAADAGELLGTMGIIAGNLIVPDVVTGEPTLVSAVTLAAGARSRAIAEVGPHQAPAGIHGISLTGATYAVTAIDHAHPLPVSDAILEALDAARMNGARRIAGTTRLYGWRTLADADDRDWSMLTAADVVNTIAAEADDRTEELPFAFVDGKGHALSRLEGILTAIGQEYAVAGALYPGVNDETGEEVDPGYLVDTGAGVNTPQTIAAGELNGVLGVRPTPTARIVNITVRKAAVGGPI